VCVAVRPLAYLTDLIVSERIASEPGRTPACQQLYEDVSPVRFERDGGVRLPLDSFRRLSPETDRNDLVAHVGEPVDHGRRVRGLRLVDVVDRDDDVGPRADSASERGRELVGADPVFGDRIVADLREHIVIEAEPRRRSPGVYVDESGKGRLDRPSRRLDRASRATVGREPVEQRGDDGRLAASLRPMNVDTRRDRPGKGRSEDIEQTLKQWTTTDR